MSGWLHGLLLADGVAFSNAPSSNLTTNSIFIRQTSTPAGGTAGLDIFVANESFDFIDMTNLAGPVGNGIFMGALNNGDTSISVTDGIRFFEILTGAGGTFVESVGVMNLQQPGQPLSFFRGASATQATVTGSKGANAALASLLTKLAGYGLIVDSTT